MGSHFLLCLNKGILFFLNETLFLPYLSIGYMFFMFFKQWHDVFSDL